MSDPISKRCYGTFTEKDAAKIIPKGDYCYAPDICPFWERFHTMPEQENGYCHYLKIGDWEEDGVSMLWDMCKECGINIDEPTN